MKRTGTVQLNFKVRNGKITLTYRKTWDQLAVVFTNHSKFKNGKHAQSN